VRGTVTGAVVGATVVGATVAGGAVVGTVVGATVVGTAWVVGTSVVVVGEEVVEDPPAASTIGVGPVALCCVLAIPTTMTRTSTSTIAKSIITLAGGEDEARRRRPCRLSLDECAEPSRRA